jgi:hypothetical protein
VGAVGNSPDVGVVVVENARLAHQQSFISSAFLERLVTDPEPLFFTPGTGSPVRRPNHLVTAISTNFGLIAEDLLNRSLPIHLSPVGNIADRVSQIGNPKHEYLPAQREQIQAELRGMIHRWRIAGMPHDNHVRHPFTEWAAVVGGILQVNGFQHFLENYSMRRTCDDPVRLGLGLIGAAHPSEWLRSVEWADVVAMLGLTKTIIPAADRDSDRGRERGIGVVLSAYVQETFHAQTDDERLTLQLEKARRRFESGQPATRYRFRVLTREPLPEDPEEAVGADQQTIRT